MSHSLRSYDAPYVSDNPSLTSYDFPYVSNDPSFRSYDVPNVYNVMTPLSDPMMSPMYIM